MAFEVKKINPLDLQPSKPVGVKLPFSGTAVFNTTYQTKDAIRTNLINYFLTGTGERYLNPSFGSPLRELMFDNITDEFNTEIESVVRRGISEYFPTVLPTAIQVTSTPDTNTVTLFLRYAIRDTNIEDEVVINFEQ